MTSSSHKHGESNKPYQKPAWERQAMFERFVMACCKVAGGCNPTTTKKVVGNTNTSS